MLPKLSGAHGPYFTRNIAIITDSAGHTGLGEVPRREANRATIEEDGALLVGSPSRSRSSCSVRFRNDSATGAQAAAAFG